jgi:WD40 repeat protein
MKQSARLLRRIVMALALPGGGVAVWLGLAYLGVVPLCPWSSRPPTLRATLGEDEPPFAVFCVAFSPDGQTLACGGWPHGRVTLWDVATGQITAIIGPQDDEGTVHAVAFSPDGRTLAGAVKVKGGGTAIKLWDRTTGKEKASFEGGGLDSVTFSPDGKTLASADEERAIKLWDVASGKNTVTFRAWGVVSIAFSPDGRTLASASIDGTVKLWDVASGKKDPVFEWLIGPWGTASSVAFSPDGSALAAGGATELHSFGDGSGSLHLWDLASRQEKTSFQTWGETQTLGSWLSAAWGQHGPEFQAREGIRNVDSVAFSPDGKTLATGIGGTVQLWDTHTGKRKAAVWDRHAWEVRSLAFSPDGKVLASGGVGGGIKLWDMPDAR